MIEKIKKFLFENIKIILFILIVTFLVCFELPFKIKTNGGLIDIENRIEFKDGYDINGSFNMAYVSEITATIPTYLISLIKKDWDLISVDEEKNENESIKESEYRSKLMLDSANKTATIVAYNLVGNSLNIKSTNFYVAYIDSHSATNLKVGDKIIEINNQKITSYSDINKIISNSNIGDNLKIKVVNNAVYEKVATVIEYKDTKMIGILVIPDYEIDSEINYKFKESETGSSGGLMMTLAIYDSLTEYDLAKGRKIAGTGTIDIDGSVGEIDGVKYKLKGAVEEKAEIFLVPSGANYNEALKIKNDNNYDIEIVEISNIKKAIEYLKK